MCPARWMLPYNTSEDSKVAGDAESMYDGISKSFPPLLCRCRSALPDGEHLLRLSCCKDGVECRLHKTESITQCSSGNERRENAWGG